MSIGEEVKWKDGMREAEAGTSRQVWRSRCSWIWVVQKRCAIGMGTLCWQCGIVLENIVVCPNSPSRVNIACLLHFTHIL